MITLFKIPGEAKAGGLRVQSHLSYITRPCFKKRGKKKIQPLPPTYPILIFHGTHYLPIYCVVCLTAETPPLPPALLG
jgi:hypothetical protein